jgi:HNH endonuclease
MGLLSKDRIAFESLVAMGKSADCWGWAGQFDSDMRPVFQGKYAYRIMYELRKGNIPAGLHIHHKCFNSQCVNPRHLIALSPEAHRAVHSNPHSAEYIYANARSVDVSYKEAAVPVRPPKYEEPVRQRSPEEIKSSPQRSSVLTGEAERLRQEKLFGVPIPEFPVRFASDRSPLSQISEKGSCCEGPPRTSTQGVDPALQKPPPVPLVSGLKEPVARSGMPPLKLDGSDRLSDKIFTAVGMGYMCVIFGFALCLALFWTAFFGFTSLVAIVFYWPITIGGLSICLAVRRLLILQGESKDTYTPWVSIFLGAFWLSYAIARLLETYAPPGFWATNYNMEPSTKFWITVAVGTMTLPALFLWIKEGLEKLRKL